MKKLLLIFLFFLPVLLYHINIPILDTYSFRQTQTAAVTRNFYKNGINFLKTELDVFGTGNEKYLLLEFPVYQAIVCIFYKLFFPSEIWGRIVSIIMAYLGAFLLFKLLFLLTDDLNFSLLTTFIYLSIPVNIHFNRTFLMEPTVIATILGFLYFFTLGILKENIYFWILGIIFSSISFLHKSLYGPFFLLPVVYLIIFKNKKFNKFILLLSLLIPLSLMFRWQMYCDEMNLMNNHFSLTLADKAYRIRNFGTISERFIFETYKQGILNLFPELLTHLTLIPVIFGIFTIKRRKNYQYFYFLFLSSFLFYFVLIKIQCHHYYNMLITPIVSIFCAEGLLYFKNLFKSEHSKKLFLTLFLIVNTLISLKFAYRYHKFDAPLALKIGEIVKKETKPDENIIICFPGYDWNSAYTYYAERKGIHIESSQLKENTIKNLYRKNYKLLILMEWQNYLKFDEKQKFLYNFDVIEKNDDFIILKLKW
ncbi:MAG TPA: glycosyltransferase family 39 protein [bacterium]|nr:glycosyltransferase family 39 protein [bacterium]HOM27423.1 glycosyltransferase family 39 protein [bacterium]